MFKLKSTIAIVSIAALLGGCQSMQRQNATTGEMETNSTTTGAIVGAVSGALVGLATGDNAKERRNRALAGAVAGGAVGAGVGNYFDRQEAALREELLNSGVQVRRVGEDQLVLVMQNGIGFASDSYMLESSIYNTLNGVARILVEYPDTVLMITGHTDSTGSEAYNQTLSLKRADSVRTYLSGQRVAGNRLSTMGMGESSPICDNSTSQGRTCNRRVEINIYPKGN
ncbi:putative lipoprotein YiaD precursor [Marinomonas aquimarina]|uniref:Putative lipoprotein YiaD n=1 Tax=Marinomonas aquimarina TaxID=295068 RepID=A0A1A8T3G3_9GAMM|nr:OmpA family protein [Marinomonas aquimarina]SBS25319.1 putative lipoprotein YiaD precursor [Marinomonas aquimarina]